MNSKILLISILILLFSAVLFLSISEYKQVNDASKISWWALYFKDPKGSSLDTVIENHGAAAEYRWEIYLEKNLIAQNSATLENEQKKEIPIVTTDLPGRKVTIRVYKGNEKRELYKIISN